MNFATIGQNIVKLTIKYWDKFLITGLGYSLSLAAITVFLVLNILAFRISSKKKG